MPEIPNPFTTPLLLFVRVAIEQARSYVRERLCDSLLHFRWREVSETLADIMKENEKEGAPFWYNLYDGLMSKYMLIKIAYGRVNDENKRLRKENKELKKSFGVLFKGWRQVLRLQI